MAQPLFTHDPNSLWGCGLAFVGRWVLGLEISREGLFKKKNDYVCTMKTVLSMFSALCKECTCKVAYV